MRRLAALILCLAAASPAYADMPARKVLEAWLEAFNTQDSAKVAAFDADTDGGFPGPADVGKLGAAQSMKSVAGASSSARSPCTNVAARSPSTMR